MKHIVLSSNHAILIAGFQTVIRTSDEFSLSVCDDAGLLPECIGERSADVLLADAACGITLDVLSALRVSAPALAIILWVDTVSTEFISQAINLGVRGVLRKNADVEMYLQCLRDVAAGEFWVENDMSRKLLGTRSIRLTPRERQLTGLLTQGLKNKELAYRLGISLGTVKVYLSRLYQKVGVEDRFDLALFALKNLATDQSRASEDLISAATAGVPRQMPGTLNISRIVTKGNLLTQGEPLCQPIFPPIRSRVAACA